MQLAPDAHRKAQSSNWDPKAFLVTLQDTASQTGPSAQRQDNDQEMGLGDLVPQAVRGWYTGQRLPPCLNFPSYKMGIITGVTPARQ